MSNCINTMIKNVLMLTSRDLVVDIDEVDEDVEEAAREL